MRAVSPAPTSVARRIARPSGRLPVALAAALLVAGGWLASPPAAAAAADDDGERRAVARSGSSSSASSAGRSASGSRSSAPRTTAKSSDAGERRAVSRSDADVRGERRRGADRGRIRAERHRHGRGGVVIRFGGGYPIYNPYWSVWAGPFGWGWGGWGYGGYYRGGYPHRAGDAGALDLDLDPEKAEIWLDGEYIGVADRFDGWPGYLWLPAGTYDLVFYKEGYETLARQYTIRPGVVIDVEDELRRGESTPPEELFAAAGGDRQEERLRRRAARAETGETAPDWRERVRRERERRERSERGDDERDGDEWDERWDEDGTRERVPRAPYDARGEAARLVLEIEPDDAAVYLDGRFLGIARDLPREVLVEPGHHEVAVVRPGYGSVTEEVEVEAGDTTELEIDLD